MKIAFTTASGGMEDVVMPVFGRAPTFTIVEIEGKDVKATNIIENPAFNASGGAGVQAAQLLINEGVKAVVSGNYGPNAAIILKQAGIELYVGSGMKVRDALNAYLSGTLTRFSTTSTGAGMGGGFGRRGGFGTGRGRGRGF